MKKEEKRTLVISLCLLAAFVLWTAALCIADVRPIGPQGSCVGFASLNRWVHGLTGVHLGLYVLTDWLSLIPAGIAAGFALLGLAQWIGRRSLWKVDRSILILGAFYLAVLAAYLLFEELTLNYRPILIGGQLEASYPSSTTVLAVCVMATAAAELRTRVRNRVLRRCAVFASYAVLAFLVVGRTLSGVHWITDIIGGLLLSAGLVMLYRFFIHIKK